MRPRPPGPLAWQGVDARFSVGVAITEDLRQAITDASEWIPALDTTGDLRDAAQIAELTGLVPDHNYPPGTRFIVRREHPHPGAQLSLFDTVEDMRHQVIATDTPVGGGSIRYLEARHRAHARVEDRIRTGRDTGFGRFPSRHFAINAAWLELAPNGHRPARLDPNPAPARRTGHRRTQESSGHSDAGVRLASNAAEVPAGLS